MFVVIVEFGAFMYCEGCQEHEEKPYYLSRVDIYPVFTKDIVYGLKDDIYRIYCAHDCGYHSLRLQWQKFIHIKWSNYMLSTSA